MTPAASARPSSPEPSRPSFRIPRSRSCSRTSHARSLSGSRISARLRTRSAAGAPCTRDRRCAPLVDRPVPELSGGELQRVAWPRRLRSTARCCLLDEPTSQLDPAGAESFLDLVAELGIAVVIAEQRPRRVLEHATGCCSSRTAVCARRSRFDEAEEWLADPRPPWLGSESTIERGDSEGDRSVVCVTSASRISRTGLSSTA